MIKVNSTGFKAATSLKLVGWIGQPSGLWRRGGVGQIFLFSAGSLWRPEGGRWGGWSEMFGWIGGTRRNCACVVLGQLGNWMRRWFIVKM